jgi:hypothetical protein
LLQLRLAADCTGPHRKVHRFHRRIIRHHISLRIIFTGSGASYGVFKQWLLLFVQA